MDSTRRETQERYRVLIVRDPVGKRGKRWRWSVERERSDGWTLVTYPSGIGTAWSLTGAREKAARALRGGGWFDLKCEEWIVVSSGDYEPTPRKESPLAEAAA